MNSSLFVNKATKIIAVIWLIESIFIGLFFRSFQNNAPVPDYVISNMRPFIEINFFVYPFVGVVLFFVLAVKDRMVKNPILIQLINILFIFGAIATMMYLVNLNFPGVSHIQITQ